MPPPPSAAVLRPPARRRGPLGRLLRRRPRVAWTARERVLASVFAALFLAALLGPSLPTPPLALGAFADTRPWHGLANAMDVLSNLPFALLGLWGLQRLRRLDGFDERVPGHTLDCTWLFFAGLIATAVGSGFYHLAPDTLRLAADRAGMAVAFAGLIGLAVCERVSQRAGWAAAWTMLAGGLLGAAVHAETGNVLPWALVQFGGMGLVLGLAALRPVPGALGLRLGGVIGCYALAKAAELGDHAIYALSHEVVSGHTLKHLIAAGAALPVLQMLASARRTP
ncbi:hypothetical protein [Xenophilus sp. Marseille-Q4582]|uniref:hypothetical protein n=1 Tax=Xenophilus sp. Marseille-Q4582 TaxID=2866600 RepID=UPI001CE42835|nr:hypothetical protein [Xenophilus sp. Marseille-Q4582]